MNNNNEQRSNRLVEHYRLQNVVIDRIVGNQVFMHDPNNRRRHYGPMSIEMATELMPETVREFRNSQRNNRPQELRPLAEYFVDNGDNNTDVNIQNLDSPILDYYRHHQRAHQQEVENVANSANTQEQIVDENNPVINQQALNDPTRRRQINFQPE